MKRSKDISKETKSRHEWPLFVFFAALAIFYLVSLVFWTLVPFFQMTTYLEAIRKGKVQKVAKSDFIFTPYTYSQRVIRYEFLKYIEERNLDERSMPLFDYAIERMEELAEKEGSNPYQHIRLGRAFDKKVEVLKDRSFFKKAEEYYKKAIALAPQRQEAYYAYGLSLVRQDRAEEAVKILGASPALDPNIPISYFYLGLAQFKLDKKSYTESLYNLEFFFERSKDNPDRKASRDIYQILFHSFYEAQDRARLATSAIRLAALDPDRRDLYLKAVDFMKKNNRIPSLEFKDGKLFNLL